MSVRQTLGVSCMVGDIIDKALRLKRVAKPDHRLDAFVQIIFVYYFSYKELAHIYTTLAKPSANEPSLASPNSQFGINSVSDCSPMGSSVCQLIFPARK